jgi:hypothetical protein
VSDCCFIPKEQCFQLYDGEKKLQFDDDDVHYELDQHGFWGYL